MPRAYPAAALVKYLTDKAPIGLYLHVPFCKRKCAYCDFYSSFVSDKLLDEYTKRLITVIKTRGGEIHRPVNTVYIGGGTPSLLGDRLITVMNAVRASFGVSGNAEITLELNPDGNIKEILSAAKIAGVNRLSVGAQSGNNEMLKTLGRTHTAEDTAAAVRLARSCGFNNISLDLMIALPGSDIKSLESDLEFLSGFCAPHISVYILKVEENTAFYKRRGTLDLPDGDGAAEQYLFMCGYLEKRGYRHYEISNFCLENYESRHNLKYWNCEEYLGIGPAAHSFLNGRRFYYPRDLKAFIHGNEPVYDCTGGDREEYIMLRLRLKEGLLFKAYKTRFKTEVPKGLIKAALPLERAGLLKITDNALVLTDRGMIVSNSIITELLENF